MPTTFLTNPESAFTLMCLHTELPLVALLGVMDRRVALNRAVFGRAGCCDQGGIDDGAAWKLAAPHTTERGSSKHWAIRVRLISPQYVKPFVKTNKNDRNDAEAIVEAACQPSMNFVSVKFPDQRAAR